MRKLDHFTPEQDDAILARKVPSCMLAEWFGVPREAIYRRRQKLQNRRDLTADYWEVVAEQMAAQALAMEERAALEERVRLAKAELAELQSMLSEKSRSVTEM